MMGGQHAYWWLKQGQPAPGPTPGPGLVRARRGIVRADGRAVQDDDGLFHPLGLTFFWGLYGWKYERERVLEHLAWLQPYGFDYLRILCEVDWAGRSIEPSWPDYEENLVGFMDAAYAHGLRCELTLIGGRDGDTLGMPLAKRVVAAVKGREHMVAHCEVVNEQTRLNKMSTATMVEIGKYLRLETPNLVGLSDKAGDAPVEASLATMSILHTRRSTHDHCWSHVRQGYDFKNSKPLVASNNEAQGPQSSVEELSNSMQLGMARVQSIQCGAAFYVLHVAQGVTGVADANHGRPQNMWEVPDIDVIMRTVRGVDGLLPEGVENWRTVNNGSQHPLPLDPRLGYGFWEGDMEGSVNKNYAALSGSEFVVTLLGVQRPPNAGPTVVGEARQRCHVTARTVNGAVVDDRVLEAGQQWVLPGRTDTMAAYVVRGTIL